MRPASVSPHGRLFAALTGLALLLLTGCGDVSPTSPTSPDPSHTASGNQDPLDGSAWELGALVLPGGSTTSPVADSSVSFSDGRVRASAACNDMEGVYEVAGNVLDIGVQSLTDRPCSGAAGEQETHVFAVLEGTPTWEVREETLVLAVPDGRGLRYRSTGGQHVSEVTASRIGGATRFDTAATIASAAFERAAVAVLATGRAYPDALAASYAAGVVGGPVLLVGADDVPEATTQALTALAVESIVLIGGTAAISTEVESALLADGYEVDRRHGRDRYETAAAVAGAYGDGGPVGTVDGDRTALLASGEDFPDAVSAGPLAAAAHLPLLATPPDRPHHAVTSVLARLDIERIIIIGGPAAVSPDVGEFYTERGYEVERIAGRNRSETAVVVARNALERFTGFSAEDILLVRGDDYPDALAASVYGAAIGAPILLTATPGVLSAATGDYLSGLCPQVRSIQALGGTGAVSVDTLDEAVHAAAGCLGST